MAVIEGLQSFLGGMDKIQSAIEGIRPPASLLQDAFGFLSDAAGNFASFIGDTLTFALGGLLTDAIQGVVSLMGDMISSAIQAGQEFQTLSIRLEGINANSAELSMLSYTDALDKARDMTKDEIKWIQQMAIITPFTATGIASVYTMQRAMGLSDQGAKDLTVSVTNWAAGMGLSEDAVLRLSTALGKATSAGKVDGLTMRALRSEFVPIPAVLEQLSKDLGVTVADLEDMQKHGKLAPEPFIKAFEEVANKRFPDAANALAHTWEGSMNNIKDVISNFGGGDIVKPILDVLGKATGSFVDMFAKMTDGGPIFTTLGTRLQDAALSIGDTLSGIVSDILGLLPSTDDIANGLVSGLETFANWLKDNRPVIVQGIKDIWQWLMNLGTNPFLNGLIGTLQEVWHQFNQVLDSTGDQAWVDLFDAIGNVGSALKEVLLPLLDLLGIHLGDSKFDMQGFIDAINQFADWIRNNKDLLQILVLVFIQLEIIQTISNLVIGFIAAVVGLTLGIIAGVAAFGFLVIIFGGVIGVIIIAMNIIQSFKLIWIALVATIIFFVTTATQLFQSFLKMTTDIFNNVNKAIKNQDWSGAGWAIVAGIGEGISRNAGIIASAARDAAWRAYRAALDVLGIHSPSTLFAGVGENIMAGMAKGITDSAGIAVAAMQGAVAAVSMPALSAPSLMQSYTQAAPSSISNTYQSSNSYNLGIINSSAQIEPIISDFNMMQSLAGA